MAACAEDLWVFAYGSLMWDPGFDYREALPALLPGFHRRFCVYSRDHRGTPTRPGLVLGLDRGGACLGLALRVAAGDRESVLSYLWEREMGSRCYCPAEILLEMPRGREKALAFIVDRAHRDYAGDLGEAVTVRLIADAAGSSGLCRDYLANTVRALEALGLKDGPLHRLERRVRERIAGAQAAA